MQVFNIYDYTIDLQEHEFDLHDDDDHHITFNEAIYCSNAYDWLSVVHDKLFSLSYNNV